MTVCSGQTLSHYRLVEKIGDGGMGVVWKAEDTLLGRTVAIKVLPPDAARDDARRRLFLQEARLASSLSHAHIAQIHDLGREEGLDFIVMEYVEGKPLNHILHGRPLPPDKVAGLGVQVAQALARAHRKGLLHRDLKPGNILVTPDGDVKVVDFGLATLMGPRDATHVSEMSTAASGAGPPGDAGSVDDSVTWKPLAGTLPYMSPEQARGETLDTRSDIFSLGTVLYEMTTGQRPFAGATTGALLEEVVKARPKPPHELVPLPLELDRIIQKGLAPSRADRYQTMEDLAVDLKRLARDLETGSSPSYGDLKGVAAPFRRRRLWIVTASLVAVIAGVVAALLLGLNVGQWRERLLRGAAPQRIDSLAVLPLANLSNDPEQEYFADGMTEELIADLSKIEALRVISRTSVMRYKGISKPVAEIARELNVDALIEGSVLRSGGRVRITAQLVEGATDRHLWAESYERDLRDVLALQGEVARAIAGEIRVRVTQQENTRLAAKRPVDPESYQSYLKGRHFQDLRTVQGVQKSVEYFEQVIKGNPNDALSYAALADSYSLLAIYGALPPAQAHPKAKSLAMRALKIDEGLAEAHASLAGILDAEWDWSGAEREYRRAIELNPNDAHARHWYGEMLILLGRLEDARAQIDRAAELDPLSPTVVGAVGDPLYSARQYDLAIEAYHKAFLLDPGYVVTHGDLALTYLGKGMYDDALAEAQKAIDLSGGQGTYRAFLALVHASAGRRGEALKVLGDLTRPSNGEVDVPVEVAIVYAVLGDKDRAFQWLEKAYDQRAPSLASLNSDPLFDSLRPDPRFKDLVRRMGLSPAGASRNRSAGPMNRSARLDPPTLASPA